MRKSIISGIIASIGIASCSSVMAVDIATKDVTLNTVVTQDATTTINVVPSSNTVTVDDVKGAATLATMELSVSGIVQGATGNSNVSIKIDPNHFSSSDNKWLFKDGNNSIKVVPVGNSWNFNNNTISKRTSNSDTLATETISFNTISGQNPNATAGNYSMPISVIVANW
ncbi:hypothetical protein ACWL86_004741 [Escherichia coli]